MLGARPRSTDVHQRAPTRSANARRVPFSVTRREERKASHRRQNPSHRAWAAASVCNSACCVVSIKSRAMSVRSSAAHFATNPYAQGRPFE